MNYDVVADNLLFGVWVRVVSAQIMFVDPGATNQITFGKTFSPWRLISLLGRCYS